MTLLPHLCLKTTQVFIYNTIMSTNINTEYYNMHTDQTASFITLNFGITIL